MRNPRSENGTRSNLGRKERAPNHGELPFLRQIQVSREKGVLPRTSLKPVEMRPRLVCRRTGGGKPLDLAAFDKAHPVGAGLNRLGYKARMSK
jgi:hypothetical protein